MGNKRAREFQQKAMHENDWLRAKNEKRPFFSDVFISGIGLRRLTLIHCPSFTQGCSWEIRELDNRLRVYRSLVCAHLGTLLGYDLLHLDSKTLRHYLTQFRDISIPLHPIGESGLDGTSFHLALYSRGAAGIQLSWWGRAQKEWNAIELLTNEMIAQFSEAPLAGENQLDS